MVIESMCPYCKEVYDIHVADGSHLATLDGKVLCVETGKDFDIPVQDLHEESQDYFS